MKSSVISATRKLCSLIVISALGLSSSALRAEEPLLNFIQKDWPDRYDHYFKFYSDKYYNGAVDWRWFKAQAIAESALKVRAKSHANARGLMQLLPSTYKEVKRSNPYFGGIHEPQWNIAAGIYYNRQLAKQWQGLPQRLQMYLTLASYNAGVNRVKRLLKKHSKSMQTESDWQRFAAHLPSETRNYVRLIRMLKFNNGELANPVKPKLTTRSPGMQVKQQPKPLKRPQPTYSPSQCWFCKSPVGDAALKF